jgi:glycosyltransferase involved in cell wall biosynthesis
MKPKKQPIVPNIGVIALVPEPWGKLWNTRQHILTRLARYFRVIWVEPSPHWRLTRPKDLLRRESLVEVDGQSGMLVLRADPRLPVVYGSSTLSAWFMRLRLRQAASVLLETGASVQIMYLWRPEFGRALDLIDHAASVYHIDDEYSFSFEEVPIDPSEAALIRRADQVFLHSTTLMERKGALNSSTLLVPNGVDYPMFSQRTPEPEDLRAIPSPRIGYIGVIKRQLDLDLVLKLAMRRAEWSFVFVGPILEIADQLSSLDKLQEMPNVHFLGAKRVDQLPGYIQHIDVCMLCYLVNAYTNNIYPLKLNEYLAAGRPVVSSQIRSLLKEGELISLAESVDSWQQAIEESLAPNARSPQAIGRRQAYAGAHDWGLLVNRIAATLAEMVRKGGAAQLLPPRKEFEQ